VEIGENDNFEVIHDKLAECGAKLLIETVGKLERGEITPEKQDDTLATHAAKIEKEDCRLDFSLPARELHNLIRGLSPIPLAVTKTPSGKLIKIVTSELTGKTSSAEAGQVISVDGGILVACGDGGVLKITRVVPEGRSKMDADAFVRGRGIEVGDILAWQ
jgi:methionyl-tRNA formyltransferase